MDREWCFSKYVFVFAGAVCLIGDALYNGYPLIYSDTSTYIVSGFELKPPFDRPITYGLFLRITSLNGLSMWGVIFAQALILSALLFKLVNLFVTKHADTIALLLIVLLSAFTGVSWTVSQLMPDIFTPIAVLCIILLLFGDHNRFSTILLNALFFVSVAMHISHLLLFTMLLGGILLFHKHALPIERYTVKRKQIWILLLLAMSTYSLMSVAISKSSHAFFMGTMVENGILKTYLDEHCPDNAYKLCQYKDSLPERAWQFLWDGNSPFYKMGGFKETKTEFNSIINATFSNPEYLRMHLVESVKATAQQVWRFDIGDGNGKFPPGTLVYERMSLFFNHELSAFTGAKQYNQTQEPFVHFFNIVFRWIILFSVLICLGMLFSGNTSTLWRFIMMIIIAALLANAWSCGTFANAIDRLGCKIIWLFPLMAGIRLWAQKQIVVTE